MFVEINVPLHFLLYAFFSRGKIDIVYFFCIFVYGPGP